jgi:HK97 family phage portal protein
MGRRLDAISERLGVAWVGQPEQSENRDLPLGMDQWIDMFTFGGIEYPFVVQGGSTPHKNEEIGGDYRGYVEGIYKRNGVVFACMAARQLLFSEARFQFQRMRGGRPGDLYGTPALNMLERPWENATTGDLLEVAITDVDLAGNAYFVRRGTKVRRLRPDWVTIVAGSATGSPIDAEPIGYVYQEGGRNSGNEEIELLPEFVAHFKAYKDPLYRFRGMSWIQSVIGEVLGDQAATSHKTSFFENGANLGYVVTMDPEGRMGPEQFRNWVETFKAGHEGTMNAYKTLFLSNGADVKVVGTNLRDLDMKAVQGAGETRICAAARVPPIIVGVSEGLESATYSNYGQARRAFADLTMRPMWRKIAGSLESIMDVPPDSRLWYDDRDIPFLQEDEKDASEIQQMQANTIRTLLDAGFTPDSVILAVTNGNYDLLKHSGLYSVQLQEPGAEEPELPAITNGNGQPQLPAPSGGSNS